MYIPQIKNRQRIVEVGVKMNPLLEQAVTLYAKAVSSAKEALTEALENPDTFTDAQFEVLVLVVGQDTAWSLTDNEDSPYAKRVLTAVEVNSWNASFDVDSVAALLESINHTPSETSNKE